MFHELFILGIAGPTSLVIISREFKSAAEYIDSDEVEETPSKHSKQQRDKSN